MGCASSKAAVHPAEEPASTFSQKPSSLDFSSKNSSLPISSDALSTSAGSTSLSSNDSKNSSTPVLPSVSSLPSSSSSVSSSSSSPTSYSTSSSSSSVSKPHNVESKAQAQAAGVGVDESSQVVVLDGGAWEMKAGIAGEDRPRTVFRNIIGRMSKDDDNGTVGRRRNGLYTVHPVEQGCITNWQAMEKIWRHTFSSAELNIRPEEYTVLFMDNMSSSSSSSAQAQRAQRQKIATIMFETFNVPAFYVSDAALFSLYAAGRTMGVVVEAGEEATRVVPVYEGFVLPHACMALEIGGASLTDHLMLLLTERGCYFRSAAEKEVAWDIKEKLGYVAADFAAEMKAAESSSSSTSSVERRYEMPDGQVIMVGSERFRATEALFQPQMVGLRADKGGVHEQVVQCVAKCDADLRTGLYQNVVLGGGSSMFQGLSARLQSEVAKAAPSAMNVKVSASPEHRWSAWIGGSILGSLSAFKGMCVTKAEYNENGPIVVDRKCF